MTGQQALAEQIAATDTTPGVDELVRPSVDSLAGYAPGEQPQVEGWVKLNTNENPYPPSPKAVAAMREMIGDRLKIYPDPHGSDFRSAAASLFDVSPDCILPGNGSDDCLTILVRTFCDAGDTIALPYPSYILYETLAAIQGCRSRRVMLRPDWSFDLDAARAAIADAKLFFLPCPNSPSGTVWDIDTVLSLIPPRGVLVLDEAYADFADDPLGPQVLKRVAGTPEAKRVVVTRTLSKSYSLAGLRIGYAVADEAIIGQMRKVKDSYNCDRLALAGGTAALLDQPYVQDVISRIRTTRERLTRAVREMGFHAIDSQANFVWTQRGGADEATEHARLFAGLKQRRVLVRHMTYPDANLDGLRLSVGSDDEVDRLLVALTELV